MMQEEDINIFYISAFKQNRICINVLITHVLEQETRIQMYANENTWLKTFIKSCYEELISMTNKQAKISKIKIDSKIYEETDERSLKELGVKNESEIVLLIKYKTDGIKINVCFTNEIDIKLRILISDDENTSLKKFIQNCYKELKRMNQSKFEIEQIQINGKIYDENNEQSLQELGLQDDSEIVLIIKYKTDIIKINVCFTNDNDKIDRTCIYGDLNFSLYIFIQECYFHLKSINQKKYRKYEIKQIQINGKKYDENNEQSLRELGIENKSEMVLLIEFNINRIWITIYYTQKFENLYIMSDDGNTSVDKCSSLKKYAQSYNQVLRSKILESNKFKKCNEMLWKIRGLNCEETDARSLNELGIKDNTDIFLEIEFNPNRIWINVYFTNENDKRKRIPMLMTIDVRTQLKIFIQSCYEKLTWYIYNLINSMTYKKGQIKFIEINGKKYEETDQRSLIEIGLKHEQAIVVFTEFNPNKIWINVFFTELKKRIPMSANENCSLKIFIQHCQQQLRSISNILNEIKDIQIKGQYYKETDERLLKEIGIQDESRIDLFIDVKPIRISVIVFCNNQFQKQMEKSVDDNISLKIFIQSCSKELIGSIQKIEINREIFNENDERTLFNAGLNDGSKIDLYIKQIIDIPPTILIKDLESLNNYYSQIIYQHLDFKDQMRVFELEKQVAVQNFLYNEQKWNVKNIQKFNLNKYHIIDNAFRRNLNVLSRNKNLIDPLKLAKQQVIEMEKQQFSSDFLIFLLANQLKQQDQTIYQTKQEDEFNILSLQASFGYGLDQYSCQQFKIEDENKVSFQQLKDQYELNEFNEYIKYHIAKSLRIPSENVHLLQIEEGSIKVNFKIMNAAGVEETIEWKYDLYKIYEKYPDAELVVHNYFKNVHLSPNDFDPKYNIEWEIDHMEYQLRGPKNDQLKYFFARGWKGYALKVIGKYERGKDDWLKMDGNQNEWHIMFHGTKQKFVKGIVNKGLNPGGRQYYKDDKDIRKGEIIGVGVYFSNHIEVVEKYADPIEINGFNYRVVFQSRVNPQKLKQIQKPSEIEEKQGNPDWDNDYFVVNSTEDIRPYRILLKKEKYIK